MNLCVSGKLSLTRSISTLKAAGESSSTDRASRLFCALTVLAAREYLKVEALEPITRNLW